MTTSCLALAFQPPFGVFIFALAVLGFGSGVYTSCLTAVIAHKEDGVLMSCLYACFGVGATFSPLLIGGFIDAGLPWGVSQMPVHLRCLKKINSLLLLISGTTGFL